VEWRKQSALLAGGLRRSNLGEYWTWTLKGRRIYQAEAGVVGRESSMYHVLNACVWGVGWAQFSLTVVWSTWLCFSHLEKFFHFWSLVFTLRVSQKVRQRQAWNPCFYKHWGKPDPWTCFWEA
jgi:hypothetical protein